MKKQSFFKTPESFAFCENTAVFRPQIFVNKGIGPLLSTTILLLITILSIALVLSVGNPAINSAKETSLLKESESVQRLIGSGINEVKTEGSGAKRLVQFNSPGEFEVIPQEDAVQFKISTSVPIFDYLSRRVAGNLVQISGADVKCSSTSNNITMENTFLKAVFNKTDKASPLATLNTKSNILLIQEKSFNTTVTILNSSVVIDDNIETSNGTGYSELMRTGQDLPVCITHFFVNSTAVYDIFYTLYAGADFIVADVRNVR